MWKVVCVYFLVVVIVVVVVQVVVVVVVVLDSSCYNEKVVHIYFLLECIYCWFELLERSVELHEAPACAANHASLFIRLNNYITMTSRF